MTEHRIGNKTHIFAERKSVKKKTPSRSLMAAAVSRHNNTPVGSDRKFIKLANALVSKVNYPPATSAGTRRIVRAYTTL